MKLLTKTLFITSHISFQEAINVDRAENQLTNQRLDCNILLNSENNTQNTQNKLNIANALNANSKITNLEFDKFDELNSENSSIINKEVISNDISNDKLAFAIINNT
jgi:hypothetical protein